MNIVAMIPVRMGSTRLRMKNLALLDGKPMMSYAVEAALESGLFQKVVVNGDAEIFRGIARLCGAEFYLRPSELGSSTAKSDQVVYDFMSKYPADIVVWVNSIAPLQTPAEIKDVVNYFIKEDLDSLVTVKDNQVHALCGGQPVNFRQDGLFAQTQDLPPVQTFVYSIMMWKTKTFMDAFRRDGSAILSGRVGYYPVSKWSSFIVKTDEDLVMIEGIKSFLKNSSKKPDIRYYEPSVLEAKP